MDLVASLLHPIHSPDDLQFLLGAYFMKSCSFLHQTLRWHQSNALFPDTLAFSLINTYRGGRPGCMPPIFLSGWVWTLLNAVMDASNPIYGVMYRWLGEEIRSELDSAFLSPVSPVVFTDKSWCGSYIDRCCSYNFTSFYLFYSTPLTALPFKSYTSDHIAAKIATLLQRNPPSHLQPEIVVLCYIQTNTHFPQSHELIFHFYSCYRDIIFDLYVTHSPTLISMIKHIRNESDSFNDTRGQPRLVVPCLIPRHGEVFQTIKIHWKTQIVMCNHAVFKEVSSSRPPRFLIDLVTSECKLTSEGARVPIRSCLYLDTPLSPSRFQASFCQTRRATHAPLQSI